MLLQKTKVKSSSKKDSFQSQSQPKVIILDQATQKKAVFKKILAFSPLTLIPH